MHTVKRNGAKKKKKKKAKRKHKSLKCLDIQKSIECTKEESVLGRQRSRLKFNPWRGAETAGGRRENSGRTAGGRRGRREGRLSRDNNEFFLFVSSFSPAMIHGESGYARSRKINYISKVKIEFGGGKGAGGNAFVFVRRRPPAARERQKF